MLREPWTEHLGNEDVLKEMGNEKITYTYNKKRHIWKKGQLIKQYSKGALRLDREDRNHEELT